MKLKQGAKVEKYIDESICARAKCKRESAVIYLGTPLCQKHWVQLCEKE